MARTKAPPVTPNGDTAIQPAAPTIEIHRLDTELLWVPIIGTSPFIAHRFSEKAKRQMLDNMQGRKSPKSHKDPEGDYRDAFYRFSQDDTPWDEPYDGAGFPVIGFKAATVGGARFYDQVTMTGLKQCLFFNGKIGLDGQGLAPIEGTPYNREDVVRVNRSGTDLRYRPCWNEWRTHLEVRYVKSMLTRNSVLSLIDAGGLGVGVGEWRPEKGGDFGTFRVDSTRKTTVIDDLALQS